MWTTKLVNAVAKAEKHGWRIETRGAKGVFMVRFCRDRKMYAAYLSA